MKRIQNGTWAAQACVILLAAAGTGFGQIPKVGFVDSSRLLSETQEGKAGVEKLNQFTAEKQKQYDQMSQELANLQQQLNSQAIAPAAEEAARQQAEIEKKQVELKRFQEDAQAGFNRQQSELLQRISDKVGKLIEEFAKQNGYSVIFIRDQTQAYVAPSLDVSDGIIKLYDQRFPVASGSATPAPPPGPQ